MENINMKSTQLVADSYKSYHHSVYLYIYYKIGTVVKFRHYESIGRLSR